jgi:cysteine desulfurase
VIEAMVEAAWSAWGNPSSVHATGRIARARVEEAREALASALGVSSRDVILTSGATEANNLALRAAVGLVTSRLEHPSTTRVAELLEAQGRPVRWLPVDHRGTVDPAAVQVALGELPEGATVAISAANHETGVIQPVEAIAAAVRDLGGRLHVDAAQAFGKLAPEPWSSADSVSIAGHKMRGPKGIGALVWACGPPPRPVLVGGSQERGIRPGTVDPVAAAGFRAAVARAAASGPERHARLRELRDGLERSLAGLAEANGAASARMPHVTNLAFPGWRGDELVAALDLEGISVSSGSACSAGTQEPPAAVNAMHGRDRAQRSVRFSLGEDTTVSDVEYVISVLKRIVALQTSRS